MFNLNSELTGKARLNSSHEAGRPKDSLFHDFLACHSPLACFILLSGSVLS
jgi:hypothetical protein